MAGVVCGSCGASTPLPDDLRVPTFACQYCRAELRTIDYAGEGAVRVDEMRAYFEDVRKRPYDLDQVASAPKLVHGGDATRTMPCVHCGAALEVPLNVTVPKVTCTACGREEFVHRYINDGERLKIDMARQVAGNRAVERLLAEGVPCPKCGAQNTVPTPVPVQIACASCKHTILLGQLVPADAVDRARLRASVLKMKDDLHADFERRQGNERLVAIVIIAIVAVGVVIGVLVSQL
ncbi:MAG: hypothetical protein AB7S26_42495 [Sandaracinaceae bacterium]